MCRVVSTAETLPSRQDRKASAWSPVALRLVEVRQSVQRSRTVSHAFLRVTTHVVERLIGRPRLVKLCRLMTNESRLDAPNDIASNGEQMVQRATLLATAPVVLDVGAHYGEWSTSLLAQSGQRPTLHLFEPSSHSANIARTAMAEQGTVHTMALSDAVGTGELLIVHAGAGSNSVVKFSDPTKHSGETESVVFTTVDLFCEAEGIERVRLLKIDAEGHDLSVIRGASSMIRMRNIEMVQFEYNHRWIDARVFLADAFEFFGRYGYQVGKITPRGIEIYDQWHPELEKFVEANYLAFLPHLRVDFPTIAWWGP